MATTNPEPKGTLAMQSWKYLIPSRWRSRQVPPTDSAIGFAHYRHAGEQQFIVVIVIIFIIEIPLVHLILDRFSPSAAWVVTGLTLLVALWIAGVFLAARQRLSWISQDELHVNDGLFTEYRLHRNNITDIKFEPIGHGTSSGVDPAVKALLSLREPVTVRSLAAPERRKEVTVETSASTARMILEQWEQDSPVSTRIAQGKSLRIKKCSA